MPITLQLLDEVNCKFLNLDLDVRKSLIRKYKIPIPNARYLPAVRLERISALRGIATVEGGRFGARSADEPRCY